MKQEKTKQDKCGAYWDAGHLLRPFTGTLNSPYQNSFGWNEKKADPSLLGSINMIK